VALTPGRNSTPLWIDGYCVIATATTDPDVVSARATCTSENRDFLIADVGAFSARNVEISVGIFLVPSYLPSA
jgi:hypothetical protein